MIGRRRGLLTVNPEPIRVVSGARRGEALGVRGWRCDHEDGRGRCRSYDTAQVWNVELRCVETFCTKHRPTAD